MPADGAAGPRERVSDRLTREIADRKALEREQRELQKKERTEAAKAAEQVQQAAQDAVIVALAATRCRIARCRIVDMQRPAATHLVPETTPESTFRLSLSLMHHLC